MDADLIPSEAPQIELLEAGAFAIVSSLASKAPDLGAKLATRLLLPYANPGKEYSRVVATLAETLERHTPGSDPEARNLLDLCRALIEKRSVRVLDGCVSMILSRYRHYLKTENLPGQALHWLLVGIELESLVCFEENGELENWQQIEAVSVCYRHMITWCTSVAGSLLRGILDEICGTVQQKEGLGLTYQTAKAMIESFTEGPLERYTSKLSEVKVLSLVLEMYDGIAANSDWAAVARNITLCLQEEANENDDGVVASLAPRSMHWDLLQLGCHILEVDEKSFKSISSFDVKGVQVLMEQFTIISSSRELEGSKLKLSTEQFEKTKLLFGRGLMRAFVAENARRKSQRKRNIDDSMVSQIRAIDLHKHSQSKQERVVQKMLDI